MTDDAQSPEPSRKGRPTPSRKEAEAERRRQMKRALTRREQMQRERQARAEIRAKQQESLRTGQGAHLPPRDRGPVKAFVRDFVDRRRNVAEYLLPILVAILLISVFTQNTPAGGFIVSAIWATVVLATVLDEIVMVRGLKRALRDRFPDEKHKGTTSYAVLRSSQLRRFRLPKANIQRGGDLKPRY